MTTGAPSSAKEQAALQRVALHPTAASHRFHTLDGLRGIAALLIVLYHIPPYLAHIRFPNTYLAVDFFFCLSGFVIAFSYERRLVEGLSFKNFMAARVIRLYPIYLLGIVFGLIDQRVHGRISGGLVAIICLQFAMLPSPHLLANTILFPLNMPAWSIFFELVANFAFALLVQIRRASNSILAAVALFSFLSLTRLVILGGSIDIGWDANWKQVSMGLARVGLSFSTGVLVFRLYQRTQHLRPKPGQYWILATAAPLALVGILLSSFSARLGTLFPLLAIGILFPPLVYLGALSIAPSSWTRLCVFLGNISYPIYLLQVVFLDVLYNRRMTGFASRHPKSVVVSFLVLLVAAAHLAAKFYDAPLRKHLTRFYNSKALV